MKSYNFKTDAAGPQVVITAGVHGDEYEPILAAMKLMDSLPSILKSGSVTIVPIVNETAYACNSRSGDDGLDLARTCPGNADGSPTQAAAYQISEIIKTADYYIDMHTGGAVYNIFPLSGYLLHPSETILNKQREMAKAFCLPLIWGTDPAPQGRTLSVARDANVPAIYVEYGGGASSRPEIIDAYQKGCLGVLQYLNMIDPVHLDPADTTYWLEDHTSNNGNLQIKMQAPIEGIFVPAVATGNLILKDDIFGTIIDPLSHSSTQIKAEETGLVFLLRARAFVQQGDSLGGILPVLENRKVVIYEN